MRLFDPKFKDHMKSYIGQCLFAALFIFGILLLINIVYDVVVAASIGASTFIAFAMPHANSSRPRYLIGGYAAGAVCGIIANLGCSAYLQLFQPGSAQVLKLVTMLSAALAVGFTMFFMTLLNLEHPPAVALALGLTREEHVLISAFAALVSIIVMSVIKKLSQKKLINLL